MDKLYMVILLLTIIPILIKAFEKSKITIE